MVRVVIHTAKKRPFKNQCFGTTSSQKLFCFFTKFNKLCKKKTFLCFYSSFIRVTAVVINGHININRSNRYVSLLHPFKKDTFCKVWLYIYILYIFKTRPVLNVNLIKVLRIATVDSLTWDYSVSGVEAFSQNWEDIRKLKRPFTEGGIHEHFWDEWKKKIDSYDGLGFLKLGVLTPNFFFKKVYYIVRSKPETFYRDLVHFNKSLLVVPKLSSSSINKYLNTNQLSNFEFQFLRKNKVYNKGRYSRCRQNYRTGVYMCMYLSVCSIFGLYYWFYSFSFNFTYLWWLFIVFVGSFFLPKIIKYRLYEPLTLINKFFDFFKWFFSLLKL